jgi:AcrR family transcriptional regulator/biotin carboxyl carrier protein
MPATAGPALNRRSPRLPGLERRRQIIEAAAALFSRKGFGGTTTREVAAAAGISEPTIFKHFATKEDLYAAIIEAKTQTAAILEGAALPAQRGDDAGVLRALAHEIIARTQTDPTLFRLLLFSALEGHALSDMFFRSRVKRVDEFLSRYIAERMKAGAFRRVDPLQAAWNFIGMVAYHLLYREIFRQKAPAHLTTDRAIDAMVDLFLAGLRRDTSGGDAARVAQRPPRPERRPARAGPPPVPSRRWEMKPRSLLLVACMALLAACSRESASGKSGPPAPPGVPVTAATVLQRDVPLQVRAVGSVQPISTVSIRGQVDGQVATVHFTEGQDVKKGDLLFTLDQRPFQADLQRAEATLAKDVAQQKQAAANLAKDMAELANAQVRVRRYTDLMQDGAIAAELYDQVRTAAQAFEAAVEADRAAVENAKAVIRADQAAVENARIQLGYTAIRSPMDGRTGNLLVHPGSTVKARDESASLVVINQIHPIYVAFSCPSSISGRSGGTGPPAPSASRRSSPPRKGNRRGAS